MGSYLQDLLSQQDIKSGSLMLELTGAAQFGELDQMLCTP